MNWSRAKTILICSFLLLNMILGFQLWSTNRSNQTEIALDVSGTLEEMNRALHSKNIRLTAELPTDVMKLKVITVKYDDNFKPTEEKALKTPLSMSALLGKGASKEVQKQSEIPNFNLYQLDSAVSKSGVYVFNQLYGKLPLFDVNVELNEKNGEITSYRQAYVEVESGVEQTEQKLIPAQLAVSSLADNYLSEGSIITEVRLGYHGQPYNSQTQPMFPHWRITVDNRDIYYLQAFNGAVESPQKGSDVLPFGTQGDSGKPGSTIGPGNSAGPSSPDNKKQ
ncbi:two-component system regulatory protein YycI [Paenibacillus sp. GCM10023248]|uniref:two-component system regulatory protein YycI n=1 Tax=Bacillales TaxID=1385 RepID=UPI00237891BA|nr:MULTISPECIES: two-component system regulatory protein YycI [Bacillales]MDD9270815.1 two-component system regulatory protein YycI [Paenibacillus sp. MAHUQ-63]MDR6883274.1 regulatory protein YycI of two-component signal transduction system YycFG [Bacillus sp. 3255]